MSTRCDSIDWNQFDDYRGTWDLQIPSLLAQFHSPDASVRREARETLAQWPYEILDQIGRLGALPLVLECVIEAIGTSQIEDRGDVLDTAAQLGQNAEEYAKFVRWYSGTEADFVASVRNVFTKAAYLLRDLLTDKDPKVRASAAQALGLVGDRESADALLQQLQRETDSHAQLANLEALRGLASIESLPVILPIFDANNLRLRVLAAGVFCRIVQPLYSLALQALADLSTIGTDVDKPRPREVEIAEMDVSSAAMNEIGILDSFAMEWITEQWISKAKTVSPNNTIEYFRRVIMATFPATSRAVSRPASSLFPFQARVLKAVVDSDVFWGIDHFEDKRELRGHIAANAEYFRSQCLQEIGVPVTREALGEYLSLWVPKTGSR